MPEYTVEVRAVAVGSLTVTADSPEEAQEMVERGEPGFEIADVNEMYDFEVGRVELFQ